MRRLAVLAFVLGCGQPTYVATGDVIAVDPAALEVTIRHEDIPGLMGAMTMPFHLRSADVLAGIGPGTRVRFELVRVGQDLTVTSLYAPLLAGARVELLPEDIAAQNLLAALRRSGDRGLVKIRAPRESRRMSGSDLAAILTALPVRQIVDQGPASSG